MSFDVETTSSCRNQLTLALISKGASSLHSRAGFMFPEQRGCTSGSLWHQGQLMVQSLLCQGSPQFPHYATTALAPNRARDLTDCRCCLKSIFLAPHWPTTAPWRAVNTWHGREVPQITGFSITKLIFIENTFFFSPSICIFRICISSLSSG